MGKGVHVIVEPFTSPPTHSKSVHTAPPFIPTSAVEFDDDDELLVALGLALEPDAVAVDARLELDESSPPCPPSSPWWCAHVKHGLNGVITAKRTHRARSVLWLRHCCCEEAQRQ